MLESRVLFSLELVESALCLSPCCSIKGSRICTTCIFSANFEHWLAHHVGMHLLPEVDCAFVSMLHQELSYFGGKVVLCLLYIKTVLSRNAVALGSVYFPRPNWHE